MQPCADEAVPAFLEAVVVPLAAAQAAERPARAPEGDAAGAAGGGAAAHVAALRQAVHLQPEAPRPVRVVALCFTSGAATLLA